jgi:hypothetical protein
MSGVPAVAAGSVPAGVAGPTGSPASVAGWSDDQITASTLLSSIVLQAPPPPASLLNALAAARALPPAGATPAQQQQLQQAAAHAAAQLQQLAQSQAAQLDGLHKRLEIFLPTRTWSKIPLHELGSWPLSEVRLQHGALPTLQVKLIHGVDAAHANELDQALLWLSESIGHPYPLVGMHLESDHSSIRLLQLATSARAVLIRIPDRETLHAQAAQAAQHAQAAAAAGVAPSASCTLFTPLFYDFMSNRSIFKSGLECCTDALQLYTLLDFAASGVHPTHPMCELNSGLNINWNLQNMLQRSQQQQLESSGGSGGVSIGSGGSSRADVMASLESMCDSIIGVSNSFRVDGAQTYTDWGCANLSLRQVVYAALNAQVAYVIACTQSLPTPFHLSDLPRSWILQAASWRNLQSRQQELSTACSMGLMVAEDEADSGAGSCIGTPQARQQCSALAQLTEFYFARYTQGEEPYSPWIATLLQLASRHGGQLDDPSSSRVSIFPPDAAATANALAAINPLTLEASSGLAIEASNASWWFDAHIAQNTAPILPFEAIEQQLHLRGGTLNVQQRAALDAMDHSRISIVDGPAGTGRTVVLAGAVLRALVRSSSIPLARSSPAVRMSAQRVLCVAESASSAAALASLLARALPASKLVLFASAETAAGWTADSAEGALQAAGYVHIIGAGDHPSDGASSFSSDRDVLVCTVSFALLSLNASTARLLKHRQSLLVEDAHNLWLLKAVLLLRKLAHTERLLLVGDSQQLSPVIAKQEGESVLTTALHAAAQSAGSNDIPFCFQPIHVSLQVQYRFSPHLCSLLSSLFYRGALTSDPAMLGLEGLLAHKKRALGWVDVPGAQQIARVSAGGSWSNRAEIDAIARLWEHYVGSPSVSAEDDPSASFLSSRIYDPSEVAILPLYESQRHELQRLHPYLAGQVFSVEQVQGREFAVVLVSLAAPGVTHLLSDPRRALVALSRARFKCFIVGDREAIAPFHSIWMLIEEYAEAEVSTEVQQAEATARLTLIGQPVVHATEQEESTAPAVAPTTRRSSSAKSVSESSTPASAGTSPEPVTSAAPAASAAAIGPSNPWSKLEAAKLAGPKSSMDAAAVATPVNLLAGISAEDVPRLANLARIFALHSPQGQPLLIDNIGKFFKAKFGTSWRAYERLVSGDMQHAKMTRELFSH